MQVFKRAYQQFPRNSYVPTAVTTATTITTITTTSTDGKDIKVKLSGKVQGYVKLN